MSELSNAGRVSLVLKGDWANNVAYTRLDMVTHDGHLYGAKKDAPAGTPLTNTVYWADFGAFSIPVATIFEAGKVKPDGVSITVDADGTIHSVATGSANLVEIDQEDYDELPETEKMDETKAYYIPNSDDDDVIEIDGEMSDISENAIANRIVKSYIDSKLVFTTWEAYKALPDTKYSDGKIYIITDVNENSESNIARGYSSVSSYNKGDAVIYDNTLYRCLVDITTPEAFNLNHWERFYVADLNSNLIANEISVPTSSWVSDSTSADYGYKATISSALYSNNFIPQYVDMIPYDGSAFFSEDENEAKGILNPNIVINASGVTFYASEIPSVSLKFRIGGQA